MEPAIATAAASVLAISAAALFRSRNVRGGVSADRGAPLDGMIAETEQRLDAAREDQGAKHAVYEAAQGALADASTRLTNSMEEWKAYEQESDSEVLNQTTEADRERVLAEHSARFREGQLQLTEGGVQLDARVAEMQRASRAYRRAIAKTTALSNEFNRMCRREFLNRQLRDRRDEDD